MKPFPNSRNIDPQLSSKKPTCQRPRDVQAAPESDPALALYRQEDLLQVGSCLESVSPYCYPFNRFLLCFQYCYPHFIIRTLLPAIVICVTAAIQYLLGRPEHYPHRHWPWIDQQIRDGPTACNNTDTPPA